MAASVGRLAGTRYQAYLAERHHEEVHRLEGEEGQIGVESERDAEDDVDVNWILQQREVKEVDQYLPLGGRLAVTFGAVTHDDRSGPVAQPRYR